MPEMSIDEFMNHSSRGGKKKFLKGWKNKDPYAITIWLHTRASLLGVWSHPWTRVELREDKQTRQQSHEVWQQRLVCHEHEDVLKNRWRDKETGRRENPPVICPHCLMTEDVYRRVQIGFDVLSKVIPAGHQRAPYIASEQHYQQIVAEIHKQGGLYWGEPIFRFAGSDSTKTKWVHAGGIFNGFGDKKMPDADKAELKAIPTERGGPIFQSRAFMQNSMPKLEYVFCVVDHDDLNAGVQVAQESQLLGDKVREVIAKAMKSAADPSHGNPTLNPYAIRWEYNPADDVEFSKKYDATKWDKVPLTSAVRKLITDGELPDLSSFTQPFNVEQHRANLEKYALIDLPWDSYFEPARKAAAHARANPAPAAPIQSRVPEVHTPAAPALAPLALGGAPALPPPPAPAAPPPLNLGGGDEVVACDTPGCPAELKITDPQCPQCGRQYEVVGAPPPPPPPRRKTRSELAAERAAAASQAAPLAAPAPAAVPPPLNLGQPSGHAQATQGLGALAPSEGELTEGGGGSSFPGDPDDDIPFAYIERERVERVWSVPVLKFSV